MVDWKIYWSLIFMAVVAATFGGFGMIAAAALLIIDGLYVSQKIYAEEVSEED